MICRGCSFQTWWVEKIVKNSLVPPFTSFCSLPLPRLQSYLSYLEIRPSARKKKRSFTETSSVQCQFLRWKRVIHGCILHQTRWGRRECYIDTSFNVVGLLHHVLISKSFILFFETASSSRTLFFYSGKSEARGLYLSVDVLFFTQISCERLRLWGWKLYCRNLWVHFYPIYASHTSEQMALPNTKIEMTEGRVDLLVA